MSADWMRKLIWMQIQLLWKIGSVSDEGRGASSGVPPRKDLPFRDSGNEPERGGTCGGAVLRYYSPEDWVLRLGIIAVVSCQTPVIIPAITESLGRVIKGKALLRSAAVAGSS